MDKIQELLSKAKSTIIHIYPNCAVTKTCITTQLYSEKEISKIKSKIKSKSKSIHIEELYFRDLVRINDTYFKKSTTYDIVDDSMILYTTLIPISDTQFPNLSMTSHSHIEDKDIEVFELETMKILFTKRDEHFTICFEVKNISGEFKSYYKMLKK